MREHMFVANYFGKFSLIWKGVVENSRFLANGTQIAVGNGKTTLFWDHKWVVNEPLSDLAIKEIPLNILGATVNEMWNDQTGWRWEVFAEFLPINILNRIQACELVVDDSNHDTLYWNSSSNGKFSMKSAMNLIRALPVMTTQNKWKLVWSVEAQNRIRFFIWLLMHNAVLCNQVRAKRRMCDNATCPLCNQEDESILQMIRDCSKVRDVWKHFCPNSMKHSFFNMCVQEEWLIYCLEGSARNGEWGFAFPVICWWIWRWRNDHVFNNAYNTPNNKIMFLQGMINEAKTAITKENLEALMKIQKQEVLISWNYPPYGWVALNTDGAAKGSPAAAGGGGIFRNSDGSFIAAYSIKLGYATAIHAELRALLQGLKLAKEKGFRRLDIRMDNMACVQILNNHSNYVGASLQVVRQCKNYLDNEDWIAIISHCYREANTSAD